MRAVRGSRGFYTSAAVKSDADCVFVRVYLVEIIHNLNRVRNVFLHRSLYKLDRSKNDVNMHLCF